MNTLLYTKKLEQMGISRENAEAHITVYSEVIMNEIATRKDIDLIRKDLEILAVKFDANAAQTDKEFAEQQTRTLAALIACTSLILGAMAALAAYH